MPLNVLAIVDTHEQTAAFLNNLRQRTYASADVSLVYLYQAQRSDAAGESVAMAAATVSSPLGSLVAPTVTLPAGATGDAYHWLPNLTAVGLSGVGLVVAAGPLLMALSNRNARDAHNVNVNPEVIGLHHALIELGIPHGEAHRYEERVLSGGILLVVQAADAEDVEELNQLAIEVRARDVSCAVRPPTVVTHM